MLPAELPSVSSCTKPDH